MSIKDLQEKMLKWEEEIAREGKQLLLEVFQPIFTKFPQVSSFSWVQYTPYYCDGEQCQFHVLDYYIDINGVHSESSSEEEWKNWMGDASDMVTKSIKAIDDNILFKIFGDHTKVTVHSDGNISQIEYADHD